jgi:hypothetical protein
MCTGVDDLCDSAASTDRNSAHADSAFGACCASVVSLAWSLAVAGCLGWREGWSGCWPALAGPVVGASLDGRGGVRWPGLPLIQMPGIPAVTRRARAGGPGQHHGPAGTSGSAGARTAIRSCPARRAVGVARVLLVTWLSCVSSAPQNPHKSGPRRWLPTGSPRTKRHSPAHGGTSANMALLALTSLYAGSAGLTPSAALVARAATGLLLTGRFMVRVHAREQTYRSGAPLSRVPLRAGECL